MSGGLSRRAFLAGGTSLVGLGAVAVTLPGAAAVLPSLAAKGLAMRRSAFLTLVGETFEIVHDRGSLPVVLHEISDLKPTLQPGAEDQFSLMFTDARVRPALEQGTYGIIHARRGRIALFVAPVDRRSTTQHYQVIINSRSLTPIS
jgi:hypothetical protein